MGYSDEWAGLRKLFSTVWGLSNVIATKQDCFTTCMAYVTWAVWRKRTFTNIPVRRDKKLEVIPLGRLNWRNVGGKQKMRTVALHQISLQSWRAETASNIKAAENQVFMRRLQRLDTVVSGKSGRRRVSWWNNQPEISREASEDSLLLDYLC